MDDVPYLLDILPGLLPGNWSAPGLLECTWEQRVLADTQTGRLLGYAEFYFAADECHLLSIAIDRHCQHQGLGSQLLHAVLEEARQDGCSACLLEVRSSNMAAIALYEAAGFSRTGIRKGYYQARGTEFGAEDALLYSLSLSSSGD